MPEYFLADSLKEFRKSINEAFPNRDTKSDGWIGDAAHAARPSEHNPCWTCSGSQYGIVRAIDVDIDDNDASRDLRKMVLNATIGHKAVWYVISNGIIYSRTHDWKALRYKGDNGHFKHVHVSINKTAAASKDKTLLLKPLATPPKGVDVTVDARALNYGSEGGAFNLNDSWFRDCQQFMAYAAHENIAVITPHQRDAYTSFVRVKNYAYAGHMLQVAVKRVQAKFNLKPDGVVGPRTAQVLKAYGYRITGL